MLLLDAQSSADAIVGEERKVPVAGMYYLIIQATDYDDTVVNVYVTVNGMTFKIKENDGTAVSDVSADAAYLVLAPRGATVRAETGDPTTGTDSVSVGMFFIS